MNEFGLNAINGILILTVMETVNGVEQAKDISLATTKTYLIKKPDEITIEVTATFNTDGVDGKLKYVFVSGNLNKTGLYEVQVSLITPTWSDKSSSYFFTIRETLVTTP